MDLDAAIAFATHWVELNHELHVASEHWTADLSVRVDTELVPMFLTRAEWGGAAPFTHFANPMTPGPSLFPGAGVLAVRTLFKAEQWTAPAAGGVVRVVVSDCQVGWTGRPFTVLDIAPVAGTLRIVAMHSPCARCKTTTVNKHGAHCDYVNRAGQACVDGLFFDGGLAFERGELVEGRALAQPDDKWAAMMG